MAKEKKFGRNEEDDDTDEANWLDSYSDLITDLLAIFVILFSFAMVNNAYIEYERANNPTNKIEISVFDERSDEFNLNENHEQSEQEMNYEDKFSEFLSEINEYVHKEGLSEKIEVTREGTDLIMLRIVDSALFDSGRADITADAKKLLDSLTILLTEYQDFIRMFRIEGHTDNVPVSNYLFKSNWELSTARAVNILKYFLETSAIEPEQLSAVGYSEYHPIAPNDTTKGRALNRRVEFIIETVKI